MSNVSLLIGAGFSIPLGYPSAAQLANLLLGMNASNFGIHSSGVIYKFNPGETDNPGNAGYIRHKNYFIESLDYFNKRYGYLDYEQYYDLLQGQDRRQPKDVDFDNFTKDFCARHQLSRYDVTQLAHTAITTLSQAVVMHLVDSNGIQFYEPHDYNCAEHNNILNCLARLGENHKVDIHSLNHDMVIERYRYSSYFNNDFSDGFTEISSPYYTELYLKHVRGRKMRISQFDNVFNKKFNLYKLHSGIDYYPFYIDAGHGMLQPQTYVKTGLLINPDNLYMETTINGRQDYFNCWVNYKPDFLSGTISKTLRYSEPLFFKKVFENFDNNLKSSEMLLVVGYGCNDIGVNDSIYNNFRIGEKPVYLAAKNVTPSIDAFMKKTNAIHIPKYVEYIVPTDIGLE